MADTNVFGQPITKSETDDVLDPATEEALREAMLSEARSGNNLYGTPINNAFVLGIPEYEIKARMDRSVVAMQWKNKDGNYDSAVKYVRDLKRQWGNGVSTLCVLYNGTGERLTYHTAYNWFGHIYLPYPRVIENGQWGAFFHVKTTGPASGSVAAVVYRGKNKRGEDTDWLVAWENPWNTTKYTNTAYAEINRAGHFDRIDWKALGQIITKSGRQHRAEWAGCVADVKTEKNTSPLWEGVLSLE